MDLSLSKLPWYGQLGAFVALSLAGAGAFWNWYAKPAQASLEVREAQLKTLRAEIAKGQATARSLPEFRQQVAELEGQLERLRTVLPEEKDVADLLRRIQGMATQSNLTIRGFKPQPVATRELHAEWPIGLELDGTYHNLGAFLERVSKFPRIINVNGINIKARQQQSATATVTAECTATTFVLIEPAAAAPAPAARGGRRGAAAQPAANKRSN
jgi:type IV pilus assembly protein PilO